MNLLSKCNRICLRITAFAFLAAVFLTPCASAQIQTIGIRPALLKNVGLDQRLNHQVPLNLQFTNAYGQQVRLSKYFTDKPVILVLVYYTCPLLCTQVLDGVLQSAQAMSLRMGKDYQIVTVSIDPHDRPIDALAHQRLYSGSYGRGRIGQGWHFLVGQEPQIKALANAVGFRYAYDPRSGQYAHPSAIMVLTPGGRISEYFYGISYPPRDLRLGLVQASNGRIGNPVDAILLLCCSYDVVTGRYGLVISRVITFAATLTLLALGLLIFYLRKGENYSVPGKHA